MRICPNEVSCAATSGETWKLIHGHRPEMTKWNGGTGLPGPGKGVRDISNADEENHARMRKAMNPAFSDRALRDQEGMLKLYVEKLMTKLRETAGDGPLNIMNFFNWTTFDVIGELAFGESFEGLDKLHFHPWVAGFLDNARAITFENAIVSFNLSSIVEAFIPKRLKEARANFFNFGDRKIEVRLALGDKGEGKDKKDLVRYMMLNVDSSAEMSRRELAKNASLVAFAGSETSGTFCSGFVYLILKHPEVYQKLCDEVRSTFPKKEDVTILAVPVLKYLNCVVQEVFRVYPPAPATLPRVVPAGGESIEGHWIPQGENFCEQTVIGINQFSTNQAARNFHNPKRFDPSRWLPEGERFTEYDDDKRSVVQPFSAGPRNCLGQNLANVEIRLILCRLLMEFDMELTEESNEHWLDQKVYVVWEKKPLMVKLRPRNVN
ncbi:MAG: hypothetical protein Q9157_001483 [Trypethelium eluteriae]